MFLQPFGTVDIPEPVNNRFGDISGGGLGIFINFFINLLIVGAGVYAVFNFVLAGYAFMSAGGDPQKIAGAWAKIWQTVLGLTVAAGALVLAALFGWLIFGNPDALINPSIQTTP